MERNIKTKREDIISYENKFYHLIYFFGAMGFANEFKIGSWCDVYIHGCEIFEQIMGENLENGTS